MDRSPQPGRSRSGLERWAGLTVTSAAFVGAEPHVKLRCSRSFRNWGTLREWRFTLNIRAVRLTSSLSEARFEASRINLSVLYLMMRGT